MLKQTTCRSALLSEKGPPSLLLLLFASLHCTRMPENAEIIPAYMSIPSVATPAPMKPQ